MPRRTREEEEEAEMYAQPKPPLSPSRTPLTSTVDGVRQRHTAPTQSSSTQREPSLHRPHVHAYSVPRESSYVPRRVDDAVVEDELTVALGVPSTGTFLDSDVRNDVARPRHESTGHYSPREGRTASRSRGYATASEESEKGGSEDTDDTNAAPVFPSGRLLERQRYKLPPCPPYRIPLYDQACMKYIFSGLFVTNLLFMELFSLTKTVVMDLVNMVLTVINVFVSPPKVLLLSWFPDVSILVFGVELAAVYLMVLFFVLVVLESIIRGSYGPRLAQDMAVLMMQIANISILQLIRLAGTNFVMRYILPIVQRATQPLDFLKCGFVVLIWLCCCLIAFLALCVKVNQISFAFQLSISDWSLVNFVQLIGLLMNLATVDGSYDMEVGVLMDAIHRHYCRPGLPTARDSGEQPCLYSRILRWLNVKPSLCLEYFHAIFTYHTQRVERTETREVAAYVSEDETEKEGIVKEHSMSDSRSTRARKTVKFLAFILRLDATDLRRYVQMIQSPLPFYQLGRDTFMASFAERDYVGMDTSVWRNDPAVTETHDYGHKAPEQFDISYECDDRRDIWDPTFAKEEAKKEAARTDDLAKDLFEFEL